MAKARRTRSGTGGGKGTERGRGHGGTAQGPQNGTGPRAKAGTCVKKRK